MELCPKAFKAFGTNRRLYIDEIRCINYYNIAFVTKGVTIVNQSEQEFYLSVSRGNSSSL